MRRIIAAIACMAAAVAAFSYQWPSPDGRYRFGFGARRDGFLLGSELEAAQPGGTGGSVLAAGDGELVFSFSGASLPGGYPAAGGGFAALSHRADLLTVYAGIEPTLLASGAFYHAGEAVGTAIPAAGRGPRLFVFDARERRFVNPLIVLEERADDKAPVIRGASFLVDGKELPLGGAGELRQGSWPLVVDAVDATPGGEFGPPFRILVLVDGSERAGAVYDAAWASEGEAWAFTRNPVEQRAYLGADGRPRFGPIQLSRGKSVVTVVAVDYAGNRREASWVLTVR